MKLILTYMAQLTGMATVIMVNLVTNLLKYGIPEMRHKMSQVGFFQQLVVALHANYHTIQY